MKHKLKIADATKQELIDYFFGVEGLGSCYRIPADKDRFLIWLEQKRADALLAAGETALEAAQKALQEYINYVKQANNTEDIDEKCNILEKANKAYARYEAFNKQYDDTSKKVDALMKI